MFASDFLSIFFTLILISVSTNIHVLGEPPFSAMFVFGDSLVDSGNNNYLNSLARANFVPYGIDFSEGPTGRLGNGKTITDILGEIIGLPLLPTFADTVMKDRNISWGVNFASAASGILDESGRNLGERINFRQQVQDFNTTLNQMKTQMEHSKLSQHLANSLTVVIHGLAPLGCIPSQLALGFVPAGECRTHVNDLADMFNVVLKSMVDQLNAEHHGSVFVYGNTYGLFTDLINNAEAYGFTVTDSGCCGVGEMEDK